MGQVLDRFYETDTAGEPVVGTYMYPLRLLESPPDWDNADGAIEITAEVDLTGVGAAGDSILVSRLGGLFIRIPERLRSSDSPDAGKAGFEERLTFRDSVAEAFEPPPL